MKVFSLFFKILRQNIGTIIAYVAVFLIIFGIFAATIGKNKASGEVVPDKASIQISDHDNTELSRHLTKYLNEKCRPPRQRITSEDEKTIKMALYASSTDYMLIIPKGFSQSLKSHNDKLKLQTYVSPIAVASKSIDMQIESYVQNYERIAATFGGNPQGKDLTRTLALLDEVLDVNVKIKAYTNAEAADKKSPLRGLAYYLSYLDYILTAISISIIGRAVIAIENPLTKKRDVVSGFSEARRTGQLLLASYIGVFVLWLMMIIICLMISGLNVLQLQAGKLMILSSFVHVFAIISLAVLVTNLAPTASGVSFFSTLMSLFLAFSSGIFIPEQFLGESFHKISSIFPTYWDVQNQFHIEETIIAEHSLQDYTSSLLLMAGMGILYFCFTLIYRYYRSRDEKVIA